MKLNDIITEKEVHSSWMDEITYTRSKKQAYWKTFSRGIVRIYLIKDISRRTVEKWWNSPSKGKFYHKNIKNFYDIEKIK